MKVVDWGYGIGKEGFRDAPGTRGRIRAVIVDVSFPWWWSALMSVDIIVTKVWLRVNPSVDLFNLSTSWCANTQIIVGGEVSETFWEELNECDWLVVGGKVPIELVNRGLWRLKNLKVVITTDRSKEVPALPWTINQWTLKHCDIGGVTDGSFTLNIATVSSKVWPNVVRNVSNHTGQDLRWVMKTNEEGRYVKQDVASPEHAAVLKVVYCGRGVICQAGLLPFRRLDSVVRSSYRGQGWVDRTLTSKETLLALDVSERLGIEVKEESTLQELIASVVVPGKVLQWVVHGVAEAYRALQTPCTTRKRKMLTATIVSQPEMKRARIEARTIGEIIHVEPNKNVRLIQENVGASVEEVMKTHNSLATKSDKAEVMVQLWDDNLQTGICKTKYEIAAKSLRAMLLRFWWRSVSRSFLKWVKRQPRSPEILEAGRDCIRRACGASWWHWDEGSRPFFWRWPEDYQESALLGVKPWFSERVSRWRRAQRDPGCDTRRKLIKEKLDVIRSKGYIEPGRIHSLMPFFDVPKGMDDIRMVYDGSASGLNACLWAPWFSLPTAQNLVRAVEPGTWMADNDIGEMFHNFMLHDQVREHCGLDISLFFPKTVNKRAGCVWERWNRMAMGLRNSPYCAVQGMLIAQEVILGNPSDGGNVFRWKSIATNLPGCPTYDPSKPWFTKIRADGNIAADLFVYVDDIRSSAPTQAEAWKASQRISSVLGYLGLQDAARKRRSPSQEAGAWTGSVVWSTSDQVSILTTQEKWDKAKDHLRWIQIHLNDAEGLDNKRMQSIRGFLVYVARTYTSMKPYLKGLHATIDSWRPGRDKDGWKQKVDPELQWELEEKVGKMERGIKEPARVKPVPHLKRDLFCLQELTKTEHPPQQWVRMLKHARVVYGFGDASKQGFGASIELPDKKIYWRYGHWLPEQVKGTEHDAGEINMIIERSSNFRELRNLVESVEAAVAKDLLSNCEIFMFTDNSTAESAYSKGTSSSEALFELVLRLRSLEMSGRCTIHLVHVAGTRMIWQGTDGLSRGDQNAGVMSGETMLSFVPLHQTAVQRSDEILPWVLSWAQEEGDNAEEVKVLEIEEWATTLNKDRTYLWFPPPAIADIAAEFMANAIHKRPRYTHVFVCPRLMCSRWFKFILKATDVVFRIPTGSKIWGFNQHEPLILAIVFPLSRTDPWKQGKSAYVQHSATIVQGLLSGNFEGSGGELRKLLIQARSMGAM